MRISIITATYNSTITITDCINSVNNQTHQNIEHIIIDGGSQDNTLEIVKLARSVTKYISEPDKGIYDALNKGIQMATGDLIGFLHSDDMLASKDTLAMIANSFSPCEGEMSEGQRGIILPNEEINLEAQPKSIDGVYGNLIFVDAQNTNKVTRTWQSKPFDRKNIKNGWMPPHLTLFLKKEVY